MATYKFKLSGAQYRWIPNSGSIAGTSVQSAKDMYIEYTTAEAGGTDSYTLKMDNGAGTTSEYTFVNGYPEGSYASSPGGPYYYLVPSSQLSSFTNDNTFRAVGIDEVISATTDDNGTVNVKLGAGFLYRDNGSTGITITPQDGDTNTYTLDILNVVPESFKSVDDTRWTAQPTVYGSGNSTTAGTMYTATVNASAGWMENPVAANALVYTNSNTGTLYLDSSAFAENAFVTTASGVASLYSTNYVHFLNKGAYLANGLFSTVDVRYSLPNGSNISDVALAADVTLSGDVGRHFDTLATAGNFVYKADAITAGLKKNPAGSSGGTIQYVSASGGAELFTLSGFGGDVVLDSTSSDGKTYFDTTVSIVSGGYRVSLSSDVLDAAAAAATAESNNTSTISVAKGTATYSVELSIPSTVATARTSTVSSIVAAIQNDQSLTAVTGENNKFTYTSTSYKPYYELGKADTTSSVNNAITVHAAEAGKIFDVGGLASTATASLIGYSEFDSTASVPAHYLFTIGDAALAGKDITISRISLASGETADTTAVWASLSSSVARADTKIYESVSAANGVFTYQASGFGAGYVTAQDLNSTATAAGAFGENIHTVGSSAVVLYANQRNGETFTLTGLTATALSTVRTAVTEAASVVTGTTITAPTGVTIGTANGGGNDRNVTIDSSAIGYVNNIVLTRTDVYGDDDTAFEKKDTVTAYNNYKLTLDTTSTNSVRAIDAGPLTVSSAAGYDNYGAAYVAAFNTAAASQLAANGVNYYKTTANFTAPTVAASVSSNNYTYTSSYSRSFYTKQQDYDTLASTFATSDKSFDSLSGYMSADGQDVYRLTNEGTYLSKHSFTISGLSTALNATSVGEIRNDNKVLGSLGAAVLGESLNTSTYTVDGASVAPDKAVVIDYTNYNVIINRAALPTSLTPGSTTISLSGNLDYDGKASTPDDIFKLSFGKGAAVESIGYGVTETTTGTGENTVTAYTVRLSGTTAGFADEDKDGKLDGKFTYQAQTGGQIFEITGLKSGLTTNQITESMFVKDTVTGAFTFKISDDLLKRFGGQYNYNDNEQITIEYKGTWDGSTINAAASNDTVTSVAFGTGTVNPAFTLHDSNADKDAYWTTVAAANSTSAQAGSFSYITEKTGYTWTDAADSVNGTQKDTLTFTKAFGGDTLATFTGLTGITDVNALASVVPVYSDAAGKAYSTVEAPVIKTGESSVTAAIQYKDSNDSVMATFDAITGERITAASGQAVGNTDLFNYVFKLPAGAVNATADGGFNVTYKPGFPTNSLAPYYATSGHIAFGNTDTAGVTSYTPAVYEDQSTVVTFARDASDTTNKTYKYVAPHIPEYYKGSASVTAITATLGTGESSQVSTLADLRNNVATATTENLATAQSALYEAVTLAAATASTAGAVSYSQTAASGFYGFTINGLPATIDLTNQATAAAAYLSFEAPSSTNDAFATVTLNAAAFKNGDNYVDGQTIRLTNINLDGNLDGKTDTFTLGSGNNTTVKDATLKLTIAKDGANDPVTVRTVASGDGNAATLTTATTITDTAVTSTSYTYKTASYQAWYELDNEYGTTTESGTVDDEISATYHASTTGSNFFTISGLAYKSADNPTALVDYDTTVNGGTIKSGSVYYDIDKNVVTVYKDALAGQNVSIGAASSTVTAALPTLDFFTVGEYNAEYASLASDDAKTAYENAWRKHAVATSLAEATHNASLETVQGTGGAYNFTAGYTEAYYTMDSVNGSASVTAQKGNPDVIKITGLKNDLTNVSITSAEGTGDNEGKTVYNIFTKTDDKTTDLFKVVYTPSTPADIEEGRASVSASYSVILQDGALVASPTSGTTTIGVEINSGSPAGFDPNTKVVLSLSDISSASSLGAASLGAADSVNTRTYITGAGTEGYILGTGDTVATYTASAQQTFTIKGLNSSVTADDITYTTAYSNKNFAIKPTALNGEDIVIKQGDATANISASIVGTAGTDYADGTKATAATLSSITANGFTFTAEGYQAGYMTAAESTTGSNTYAKDLGAHTDAAILYVGKRHGETVTLNGLKLDTTKISLGAATDENNDSIINDSELAKAFTAGSGVTLDSTTHAFTVDASVLGANSITLTYPTSTTGYETGTTAGSTVATYALSPYDLNIAGSDDVKAIEVTVQTPMAPGKSFVDTYASLFSAAKETVLTAAGTDITTAATFATVTGTQQGATNATYDYASSYDKAYFTKLPTYDADAAKMTSLLDGNLNKLFGKYMANEGQVLYTYNEKAKQTTFSISGLAPTLNANNLQEIKLAGTAVDTTKAVVVDYTGSKVAVSINSADALPANADNRVDVSLTGAAVDSVAASGYTLTFGSALTSGKNEILSEDVTFGVTEDATVSGKYTVTLAGKTPGYVKNSDGTGYTYQTLEGGQRYTIEGLKTGLASSLETALANASVVSAGSGTSTITVPILQSYLKDSYEAVDNAIKLTYLGQVNNTTAHGGADSVSVVAGDSTQFAFDIASIGHANAGTASNAHWEAESNITVGSGTESGFVFYDSKSPDTITPGVWDSTNNTIGLSYASATGGEALIKLTGLTSGTAITQLQASSYASLESTKGKTIANLDSNDPDYSVAYKIASFGFVPCDTNGNPYTLMVADKYNGTEFVKKVVYYDSEGQEVTGNSITNFLLDLPDGTFPTLATGVTYQAGTASNGDFKDKDIRLSFGGIPSASDTHTVGAAVESVSGSEGTYDITSKYSAEYYKATTNSGLTTYTHFDSVGKYSYTISGLPASITSSNLGTYLTNSDDSASSTITAHKVTLQAAAFNTGNYADGATIIELTNIDADGNGVVDTSERTSHNVKLVMPAQTDDFKTEKTQKTAPQFTQFAAGSGTVPTTYKYTTTGYHKYYTLDPETSSKVTYHAEVNAYDLFRISGVSNTATISGTGANIIVDEPTGKVTLYNTALDDKDITFTVMQDKEASLSLYDQSAYDAGYAASTNKAKYKTDHENLIVTTDATKKHHAASVDSSAAANGTYTFTAGYTDEYYTANGTGYKFTPQAGTPDVIALSGLKQNLALTVADDKNGGYTFTDASGNTVLTVKYHEKESSDNKATAGIDESTNRYEVILNDAAIADTHGNIGVTINSGNPTGADTTATAYFNIDSLSANVVPTDATATLAAAGDDGTRTYTSTGKTAGYAFTTAGQLTSLAWQETKQKTFTITGLTADATADNISYVNTPAVGTTAESHAFTIASAALDNKNNILIKQGSSAANINATISGDYAKGTDAIPQSVTVSGSALTYTNTGNKAGYLTAAEATAATIPNTDDAQFVYSEQRGGEQFKVTGLNSAALTVIGQSTYTIPAAVNNVITFTDGEATPTTYFTLNTKDNAVTLAKAALDTVDVTFTNESGGKYTVVLDSDGNDKVAQIAPTVTVNTSSWGTGTKFAGNYKTAFETAAATLAAADNDIQQKATLTKDSTTATTATSAVYNYKSSYTTEYFTKLPTYDATAAALANAGGANAFSQLENICMAANGSTVYKYNPATTANAFSIAGLSTTDVSKNFEEVTTADGTSDKAIVVNTAAKTVTISDATVLAKADTVSLSGDGASGYTLDFAESLKSGANDILSETITYSVAEDTVTSGKYTVTLGGNTAGYDDSNKTWQAQNGGQVFTITGLKSSLSTEDITANMFVAESVDGAATGNFTFNITNALLDDKDVSVTLSGTVVDVASGTETQDSIKANDNKTVVIDASAVTVASETNEAWSKEDSGAFVFTTAKTAAKWTPGEAGKNTTLTYGRPAGGDALINLSGLTASSEAEMPKPVYADEDGKLLCEVDSTYTDTSDKSNIKIYNVESWYKAEDVTKKDDGVTYEAKENTTPVVKIMTNTNNASDVQTYDTALKAYRFNLDKSTFDASAMVTNGVTYKAKQATDNKFKGKEVFIAFNGELPRENAPAETPETLTPATGEDGKAVSGSYKYVSKHTDAYYKSTDDKDDTSVKTYNFVRAIDEYGFTINGLPADTKTSKISNYFTFKEADTNAKAFNVTLTEAAFGDADTTKSGAVISLTNIDLDGDNDNKDDATIALVMPEASNTFNTDTAKVENKASLTTTDTTAATATYTYNATKYKGFYALADDSHSVNYTTARGGDALFKLDGLSTSNAYSALPGYNASTGALEYASRVIVNEGDDGNYTVMLTKAAFNGQYIKLTAVDSSKTYTLALYDELEYAAAKDDFKAVFNENLVATSDSTHNKGKFVEGTNGYTFTAGYTPAYYGISGDTASYHDQVGHADEIQISNLAKGLTGEDYTFTDDGNGNYTVKKGDTTVLEIVYTAVDENDAAEAYTVKLYDGALPTEGENIELDITAAEDRGSAAAPATAFDVAALTKTPRNIFGSFTYTAADEEEKTPAYYTFTAEGTTDGYTLDADDATKVNYHEKVRCATFTLEGIKDGLAIADTATKQDNDVIKQLETKGITIAADADSTDKFTVTLIKDVLADADIKLTDDENNYTLVLAEGIYTDDKAATEEGKFSAVNNGTATYTTEKINKWYEESGQANEYTFHGERGGATFDIKGLATDDVTKERLLNTVAEGETAPIAIKETGVDGNDDITVTVTFNDTSIFGKSTIEFGTIPEGYEISMEVSDEVTGDVKVADNREEVAKDGAWDVTSIADGNATFKAGGFDAYYQKTYDKDEEGKDTTDLKSLTYFAEIPSTAQFALAGLNASLDAANLDNGIAFNDDEEDAKTVTINDKIGGENGATITSNIGGYSIIVSSTDKITGTENNDFFTISEGATVDGGKGDDTFKGDGGTIVFSEGKDTVDYAKGIKIQIDGNYSYEFTGKTADDGTVSDGDVILKRDNNTLTIKNAGGETVTFVDSAGNETAVSFDQDLSKVFNFNSANPPTAVTVTSDFTGDEVGPNHFAIKDASNSIITIDASAVDNGLKITGTGNTKNVIIGTANDDTLDPGISENISVSSNTFKGGEGDDLFIYRGGNLTITDFNTNEDEDSLQIATDAASIESIDIKSGNITFDLSDGKKIELTNALKSASVTAVAIQDADGDELSNANYYSDGIIEDETTNAVTLTASYTNKSKTYEADAGIQDITAYNTTAIKIDASKTTKGVDINATAAANTLIGGTGSDTFTGATGKADLFVYDGRGADEVTNFEAADKVSLTGVDMSNITAVSVTADNEETAATDESAVKLSFGGTNSLNLKGAKDTVNVNGTAYIFEDNAYLDNKKTGITLTSGSKGTFDASGEAYSSVVSIDASAVTSTFSIAGNAKDNVITAGNSLGGHIFGDEGKDLFVFNGGFATILDYSAEDKDSISVASGLTYNQCTFSNNGKDVILTYLNSDSTTSNLTIVNGADQQITFVDDKKKASQSLFSALGQFNNNNTAVTLNAGVTEFNAQEKSAAYPKLATIVASSVTGAAVITANDKNKSTLTNVGNTHGNISLIGGAANDMLIAGEGGDYLDGGKGNDTVSVGGGTDTVVIGAGGTDTVKGFNATKDVFAYATVDSVKANITDAVIATKSGKSNLTLTLDNDSKVVVEDIGNGEALDSISVTIDGQANTFGKDFIGKGTEITLTSAFKGTVEQNASGRTSTVKSYTAASNITKVDASATSGGFTLQGGANNVELIGGKGADVLNADTTGAAANKLTGGAGNDVFIYSGGNDTITDFGNGSDKISLSGAFAMSKLSAVKFTEDEEEGSKGGTYALGFGENNTLNVYVEDATKTKTITIADSSDTKGAAYTFPANGGSFSVGKEITLLGGGDSISLADEAYKDYKSVAVQGAATVTAQEKKGGNIKLLSGGQAIGGNAADTLAALGGETTLTGSQANDLFIYNGGNAVITDYSEKNGARNDDTAKKLGADKVSLGSAVSSAITGIAAVEGGFKLSFTPDDAEANTNSLTFQGINNSTKVDLTTTTEVNGKLKATKTKAYFSDGAILDNSVAAKAKSAIVAGTSDFSSLTGPAGQKGTKDAYAALVTITSANAATITGNSKNNVITLSKGGSVKGGIGNDTYIIGGNATIGDFGIGATTITDQTEGLRKLPTKVDTVANTSKSSIIAYSPEVGGYAEGKDKVQVDGTIIGVSVSGIKAATKAESKATPSDSNSFSVTLSVDNNNDKTADFTVVLDGILRPGKYDKTSGVGVNSKSDYTDLNSLQIFELNNKGKYTKVKWDNLVTLPAASSDAPDFGSADLDEIMDVTPAVTTGDSSNTKDADNFIITGSGDDSSDLTSKKN